MEKNEKLKALDAALGQIEKQFGKGVRPFLCIKNI